MCTYATNVQVLVVGGHDFGPFGTGAVWIFELVKYQGWKETAFIQPADVSEGADFGWSLSINQKVCES